MNCKIPILVEQENREAEAVYDTKECEFVFSSRFDTSDHR